MLVRAGVLAGVPLAAGIEPEDGDLGLAVLDRAAAVGGKVAHRPDAHPLRLARSRLGVDGRRPSARGTSCSSGTKSDGQSAGRCWPRSVTNSTPGSVSSVLANCWKNRRFSGSSTTAFHSHSIGIDERLHLPLELGRDAEPIVDDHVPQVLDPAFHLLEPDRRAGQPVGRPNVVHEEPVEIAEGGLLVEVGGEQVGVPRLGAAVAADVEVVAVLGGDQAEVLALGLGALADAAGDGPLELVRGPEPAVAQLDPDGEPDRVLNAVAAPGRADAALDGAHAPCRRRGRSRSRPRPARPRSRAADAPARRTGRCAGRP